MVLASGSSAKIPPHEESLSANRPHRILGGTAPASNPISCVLPGRHDRVLKDERI